MPASKPPARREEQQPEWLEALEEDYPPGPLPDTPHVRVDDRPEVKLGKDVHRVVEDVQRALSRDPLTFQRQRALCTVVGAVEGPLLARDTPVIRQLTSASALLRVSKYVKCMAAKKLDKLATLMVPPPPPEWQEVQCPPNVLGALLAAGDYYDVKPLIGISETPVLRNDGSVWTTRGYDPYTGYLYAPSCEFADPGESQHEAKEALARLADLFVDFPHKDDVRGEAGTLISSGAHKMVPIAALLTILSRSAIAGPVPAFIFSATVEGSGKGLQADVVHCIAFGRTGAHGTLPTTEEEREKTLSAVASAGLQCLYIDNVKGLFGGPKVEATLTSENVAFRILGHTEYTMLPWRAVMLVTGNNMQITRDARRRSLFSQLETPLVDPTSRRSFAHRLPHEAIERRVDYVTDALTILRSYLTHKAPDVGVQGFGTSYEAWERVVAGAIVWAGGADVTLARAPAENASNDETGALATLLSGWARVCGPGGVLTSRQLVYALGPSQAPDGLDDLREALESLCPPKTGRLVNARDLSYVLRRLAGRWTEQGQQLVSAGEVGHSSVTGWRVNSR